MKKTARTLSIGASVGVAALAAVLVTTTPAAAAASVRWHVNKSMAYCKTLDNGTTLGKMKRAQCESETLSLQAMLVNESIARQTEILRTLNWPGPGH
ncbi:hypothetical protein ACQEVG_19475 [Streptomyces sp. CA-135486]|uniref:hypothetical protein n=1 Tax=Streptomyces sp. CA-135486 TaxID=3240049 RepID=UPI003D934A48